MIQLLEYQTDEDRYGNIYGSIPPSNGQIIDKINEIVEYINGMENKPFDYENATNVNKDFATTETTIPFGAKDSELVGETIFIPDGFTARIDGKKIILERSQGLVEALHTEYERGRADVIENTISWLANVWPQYCDNPNIIDAYKEAMKE